MEIEESGEEKKDFRHLLFPSIFDTYSRYIACQIHVCPCPQMEHSTHSRVIHMYVGIFCYKIKALNFRLEREAGHEEGMALL